MKKAVLSDGSYTKYHYDSDNLEYEEHYTAGGSLSYLIKYFYDDQDRVQYALYKNRNFTNSTGYYNLYTYVYNGFGEITDIIKLRNGISSASPSIVNQLVAHYEYDPYGNITKETAYNSDTFLNINPIKYKAYYYDKDLSWYRLDTRYYDPSVGRFINCDGLGILLNNAGEIVNKNLYAYCNNNPIMYMDNGGDIPILIPVLIFIAGGGLNTILEYSSAAMDGRDYTILEGCIDFASGGIATTPVWYISIGIDFTAGLALKNKTVSECLSYTAVDLFTGGIAKKAYKVTNLIEVKTVRSEIYKGAEGIALSTSTNIWHSNVKYYQPSRSERKQTIQISLKMNLKGYRETKSVKDLMSDCFYSILRNNKRSR